MSWAVCMVETNREKSCHMDFERMGIRAYVPLGRRLTKPKRKKKPVQTTFCPFPGYMFVEYQSANQQSLRCKQARGFRGWLRSEQGLRKVSNDFISTMKRAQMAGDFDKNLEINRPIFLKKGEYLQVISGPFVNCNAIVAKDNKGKSWVSIDVYVFSSAIRAKILVDFVRRVDGYSEPIQAVG